jgi:hypothetical protein
VFRVGRHFGPGVGPLRGRGVSRGVLGGPPAENESQPRITPPAPRSNRKRFRRLSANTMSSRRLPRSHAGQDQDDTSCQPQRRQAPRPAEPGATRSARI